MSEMCPFLKEIKSRDRDPLRSLVDPDSTRVPQDLFWTQAPVSLNCLCTMVVRAGIVTGESPAETQFENLLLLVGFWLCNLKKGTRQPFPIGLD